MDGEKDSLIELKWNRTHLEDKPRDERRKKVLKKLHRQFHWWITLKW